MATEEPLTVPRKGDELAALFAGVLNEEQLRALTALHDDNHRAIEDSLNTKRHREIVHLSVLSNGLVSDRYYPTETGALVGVQATLTVAGSSSTVVDVNLNGVSISTLTLTSGLHVITSSPMTKIGPVAPDYVTVTCTTTGTSAAGLLVILTLAPGLA